MAVDIRVISSLEKVFLDEEPKSVELQRLTALRGEKISFQVVCSTDEPGIQTEVSVKYPFATPRVFEVKNVPVTLPASPVCKDDYYLRVEPGLYPDVLVPYDGRFSIRGEQWRSLWITVDIPVDAPAGDSVVTVELCDMNQENAVYSTSLVIEIIPVILPEQTIYHTEWIHVDCLATYYNVPIFSEEHWGIIGNYMRNMAEYGVNMILTPIFTPPLDTKIGSERPTVQLVDVTVTSDGYEFCFEQLERYMNLAETCGIKYFEMSHLFTQWGAKAAPKIVAMVHGEEKKLFGWDTDAASETYKCFLQTFLRAFTTYLRQTGRAERCFFHISDEPELEMLDSYKKAKEIVAEELTDFVIIDALSNYEFYRQGVVQHPIPCSDNIDTFIENGVDELWTYYCSAQWKDVSNRFIAMPSARNRILGYQLFKYNIQGFLHWGFNFWYSQFSLCPINPFVETGSMDGFQAGDAFLVYPGFDGKPWSSLRQLVLHEGLQDLRALQLLATLSSHEEVVELLESEGQITFKDYPRSAEWLLNMRERVNQRIRLVCEQSAKSM